MLDLRRVTARPDREFVVFLIGMRVNAWWKPWKWMPVAGAMPRMLEELDKQPSLGFLGGESFFGRTTLMLSYWESAGHLLAFAKDEARSHMPAWKAFYAQSRSGDVGIWHETYTIAPGTFENVYVGMPPFGLGRAFGVVEARGDLARAKGRLAGRPLAA